MATKEQFSMGPRTFAVPMSMHRDARRTLVERLRRHGVPPGAVVLLQGGEQPQEYDTDRQLLFMQESFFQYLFGRGITATNLALSIPKAAQRWAARLPRHLLPEGVEAVLGAVRANPRHSARDYAMLLLMARLGLRAAEVIAIQLDDIDWRAGRVAGHAARQAPRPLADNGRGRRSS
jgi:integrase